jgi:dolichol-phosphate mannosyltransferase
MTLAPGQGVSGPKVFQLPPSCPSPDTAPWSPFGRLLRMVSGAGPGRTDGSVPGLGRVVMVVPTYNEALNLETLLERLRRLQPDVDVLVVDDNSPDGTGDLADARAAEDPAVTVLHRTAKEGLGAAYLNGFQVALARGYDVIGEMDADGSHQPEQLPDLLAALPSADLVLGSRWVPGGHVVNWPLSRQLLSRGGNTYVRMMLGFGVRDATGGFRAFRRGTLEALSLEDVNSAGYCFQVDLAWRTVRRGFTVTEVPIGFVERELGTSKMSGSIVREALWRVTIWGVAHRFGQLRGLLGRGG